MKLRANASNFVKGNRADAVEHRLINPDINRKRFRSLIFHPSEMKGREITKG